MTRRTMHCKQRPLVVTEDKQRGNVNQKYCDIWPDEKVLAEVGKATTVGWHVARCLPVGQPAL